MRKVLKGPPHTNSGWLGAMREMNDVRILEQWSRWEQREKRSSFARPFGFAQGKLAEATVPTQARES